MGWPHLGQPARDEIRKLDRIRVGVPMERLLRTTPGGALILAFEVEEPLRLVTVGVPDNP
jgi:hypothetical protein